MRPRSWRCSRAVGQEGPKEDLVPKTQDVCYDFCHPMTSMDYVGLIHGRGGHYTSYYKEAGVGDSGCDLCEDYMSDI